MCPTDLPLPSDGERACRNCAHYRPGPKYRERSEPFPISPQARRGLCLLDGWPGTGKRDWDLCRDHEPRKS